MPEQTCEICGYEGSISVVFVCEDGIKRCKLCRQRAEFGQVVRIARDEARLHRQGAYRPDWIEYLGDVEFLEETEED